MSKIGRSIIVGAEYSSSQAVVISVSPLSSFVQSLELLDHLNRSKDLFLANGMVISNIGKHGRLKNKVR